MKRDLVVNFLLLFYEHKRCHVIALRYDTRRNNAVFIHVLYVQISNSLRLFLY